MSNKRGNCRIMSGHKMDTSQRLISYIIRHRKTVTGGVVYVEKGRKVSKTAGISSIPTRLIPHLFHTTSPSNLSLSSSSHSHHSALPLQIHLFTLHSLTSAKDLQTLLPSTIWPFWITKDIESLPKNSREYPSPEPYCLPLDFLSILKKVSNSPKITTEYSPHYYPEPKNLHRLSLK